MKRAVYIYIGILVTIFIVLSVADQSSDYVIERKLWNIHKQYMDVTTDPDAVPDRNFEEVAKQYQHIIDKYPDSSLIQGVHLLLGEVFLLKGDYPLAREKFQEIIEKYKEKNPELVAEAMGRIGRTYEDEANWEEAEKIYTEVAKVYPQTNVGMNTPLYVATRYKEKNDYQMTMKAYEKAILFYQGISETNPDSVLEFNSLRFLANCYLDQSRWQDAINTFEKILLNYSGPKYLTAQRADMMVKTINVVSAYQLKDYDVAISLYNKFIDKHPEHPLNGYLTKMVGSFQQLKEQGVKVSPVKTE